MDIIYFIDCLSIVSALLLLNAPLVFYHFNHVLFMKCVVLYHNSVFMYWSLYMLVRNDEIKMSNINISHNPVEL